MKDRNDNHDERVGLTCPGEAERGQYEDHLYRWENGNFECFTVRSVCLKATELRHPLAINFWGSTLRYEIDGEQRYGFELLDRNTVLAQSLLIEPRQGVTFVPGYQLREQFFNFAESGATNQLPELLALHQEMLSSKGHAILVDEAFERDIPKYAKLHQIHAEYRPDSGIEDADLLRFMDELRSLNSVLASADACPDTTTALQFFDDKGVPVGFRHYLNYPILAGSTAVINNYLAWLTEDGCMR